eukprot:702255-Pelagomonas_calceolata.AAC.7
MQGAEVQLSFTAALCCPDFAAGDASRSDDARRGDAVRSTLLSCFPGAHTQPFPPLGHPLLHGERACAVMHITSYCCMASSNGHLANRCLSSGDIQLPVRGRERNSDKEKGTLALPDHKSTPSRHPIMQTANCPTKQQFALFAPHLMAED